MSIQLPDWMRGSVIFAKDPSGNLIPLLVDASGQLNILIRGTDSGGTVRTVRVDTAGQLYAILRGAGGNDVSVDASGNLSAILKGEKPDTSLGNVAVDASGRIIMVPYGTTTVAGTATVTQAEKDREIQGADGATLRTIAVDSSGQIIMVPRGQSGNYMSVDASGYLSAILKGLGADLALHTVSVDNAGQIVMVPRGASGNYMSVDANGFMTAILKGIQDGTLTTIAVDASGRIQAFALDGEDQWGKTLKTGNSELAARLSPLRTYDWRGNTLYQCDFSKGIPTGYTTVVGTGAVAELDPTYWRTGGYSLKLTGASSDGGFAYYEMDQANPPARYIGLQVEFSNYPDGTRFAVTLEADYLGSLQKFGLAFDFVNDQLEYRNASLAWTDFYPHTFVHRADLFYRMKFVVDVQTGKYVRALFLNHEIDMSAYSGQTLASLYLPYIKAGFGMYSRVGYNDPAWLDNYVVTTNEPTNT